jgi:hypothetical protein
VALGIKVAPRQGIDYHLDGCERAVRRFGELQHWFDARVGNAVRIDDVVEGAKRIMAALITLHQGVATPV